MEISRGASGSFIHDRMHPLHPFMNKFPPIYAENSWLVNSELPDEIRHYYTLPNFEDTYVRHMSPSIRNITKALETMAYPCKFEINGFVYYIMKGVIFDGNKKPLLVVTYREGEIEKRRDGIDGMDSYPIYSDYLVFYSTSFLMDPALTLFNRRLQKTILLSCYSKGMEVRVIDSETIQKNTFARLVDKPFKSISDLEFHLKERLPLSFMPIEEDTIVREPVAPVSKPLSLAEEARQLGFMLDEEIARGQNASSTLLEDALELQQIEAEMLRHEDIQEYLTQGETELQLHEEEEEERLNTGSVFSSGVIGVDPYDGHNFVLPSEVSGVSFVREGERQTFGTQQSSTTARFYNLNSSSGVRETLLPDVSGTIVLIDDIE